MIPEDIGRIFLRMIAGEGFRKVFLRPYLVLIGRKRAYQAGQLVANSGTGKDRGAPGPVNKKRMIISAVEIGSIISDAP